MAQHPNARLTPRGRETLVSRVKSGAAVAEAARQMGVSRQTASKWLARAARGESMSDRPCRPRRLARSTPPEAERRVEADGLKVMYSGGPYGYDVKPKGTVHGAVLDLVGVSNVADLAGTNSTEVSPEQVMVWAPEVLLVSPADGFFDCVYDDATWAGIPAVENRRVYEVPGEPYEWMDKPPSVQTLLGVLWLGNLLYPEVYNFDMTATVQEFYQLFWGYELSESAARAMLANSTLLAG